MIPPWLAMPELKRLPWKLIGYGVAALAIVLLVWRIAAWREGYQEREQAITERDAAKAELAALQKSVDDANKAIKDKDAAYQKTLGERDAYASQVAKLLIRPQVDPQSLIAQVPTHAPVTACPDRSRDYWLRYNEIAAYD